MAASPGKDVGQIRWMLDVVLPGPDTATPTFIASNPVPCHGVKEFDDQNGGKRLSESSPWWRNCCCEGQKRVWVILEA